MMASASSAHKRSPAPSSVVTLTHGDGDEDESASPSMMMAADDDDDDDDDIEHDQDDSPAVIIASCQATIVGIRYYSGVAHAGEYISLVREPQNPYDKNAIRVDNMQGDKVGHVKKEQARLLAPFLDHAETSGLSVEGTIPYEGNAYTLPCSIEFFARAPPSAAIAEQHQVLQERSLSLMKNLKKAFGKRNQFKVLLTISKTRKDDDVNLDETPNVESKKMDWRNHAKDLDSMFEKQQAQQLANLPDIPMPPQLKTQLLDYQVEGIKWLVHQEKEPKLPFYEEKKEKGRKVWHCTISHSSQLEKPKPFRAGMLCDAMGLGKTLQVVGLLLASPPPEDSTNDTPQCTLIVAPPSVIGNWTDQIEAHVEEGALKVGVYQGSSRSNLLPQIRNGSLDVLLVTYHTLAAEFTKVFGKPNNKQIKTAVGTKKAVTPPATKRAKVDSIFNYDFHRIVLDESHMIRSCRTTFFHACTKISARSKFALTGTPFVNRADDIYSLLHFLGVEPLCDKKIYQRAITTPIENGDDAGLACLRVAMAHVALRRSKDTANIQLPEKTVQLSRVSFKDGSPHKTVYDALFGTIRLAFEAVLRDGDKEVLKSYTNIFEKLLRLRQACCSARLVPKKRRDSALELWKQLQQRDQSQKLTAKEGLELLEKLKGAFAIEASDELPECAVCLMEMEIDQAVILRECRHVYCEPCISQVCTTEKYASPKCPLCRKTFTQSDMIKKNEASVAATQTDVQDENMAPIEDEALEASPKVLALLNTIKTTMSPDEKGVIFSQFTSFLNLIQDALNEAGHSFTRLDGSMTTTRRMEAIRAFSSEEADSPRFILCSLHAAGTGINLTRGSAAFMLDVWWNASVENQAMDRIYRIGQKRNVTVHRFVMKDSLEERIVALQEAKNLQAKGAMQKLKPEEQRKARLQDLKGLLMIDEN